MNKKVVGIIITAILCVGFVIGGIFISKINITENEINTQDTVQTNTTTVSSVTENIHNNNIVFETLIDKDEVIVSNETDADNRSNYDQGTTNKIYIDGNAGNETVSGGNFVWR